MFSDLTFLDSSKKKSLARAAMRSSGSTIHEAISLIWPLTFTISFKIKWVRTMSVFLRTCEEESLSLKKKNYKKFQKLETNLTSSISKCLIAGLELCSWRGIAIFLLLGALMWGKLKNCIGTLQSAPQEKQSESQQLLWVNSRSALLFPTHINFILNFTNAGMVSLYTFEQWIV